MIEIWSPRWHDRVTLVAKYKVRDGVNKIKFTKAKSLKDTVYSMEGDKIKSYPLETNGTIPCYAVSLDDLLEGDR